MKGYTKQTDGIFISYKCNKCSYIVTNVVHTKQTALSLIQQHVKLHSLKYKGQLKHKS